MIVRWLQLWLIINKQQKLQIEREKIKLSRDNQANDLAVAKENAKGRNNKKTN
jgi:hypothetical protein